MSEKRFAIIVSRFNTSVTDALLVGAKQRFTEHGITANRIDIIQVAGAVEIPLIAQQYARQNRHAAIVCLGAVIQGETRHFDYVCQQVSYGCQKVALDYNIPVIFGILTTHNAQQALARADGTKRNKGADAVDAAIEMSQHLDAFKTR